MLDRAKLLLKDKYCLVHVPNRHKVIRWAELTRSHRKTGQSVEHAGLLAARTIFPHELKEYNIYSGPGVESILFELDHEAD
ncbi:MAG TPA: hypothetical protein VMW87_15375 [Spirochaetia bacterium]|nr:hypothetical protein [Spirochaetia bacterium]